MAKKVGPYRPYLLPSATQAQTYCGASKKWSGPTLNPQCPPTGRPDPGTLIRGIWYLSYTVVNRHAAVAAAALAAGRASRGTVGPPQGHGETRAGLAFS